MHEASLYVEIKFKLSKNNAAVVTNNCCMTKKGYICQAETISISSIYFRLNNQAEKASIKPSGSNQHFLDIFD